MPNDKQPRARPQPAPKEDPNHKTGRGRENEEVHRGPGSQESPAVEPFDEQSLAERMPSSQDESDE